MTLSKPITIRARKKGTYWLESKQGYYHTLTPLTDYTTDECYWLLLPSNNNSECKYNILRVLRVLL